jgi:hypothetical protein
MEAGCLSIDFGLVFWRRPLAALKRLAAAIFQETNALIVVAIDYTTGKLVSWMVVASSI